MNQTNEYLNEVMEQQAQADLELKRRSPAAAAAAAWAKPKAGGSVDLALEPTRRVPAFRPADYRVTGWLVWKTVLVPPNVYVVHTRRGHDQPLHIGLGISFRYNPYTDTFLVVPASVQTLFINARCICKERQGILVQAYVQWIVDDIAVACRKLDFSDPEDPMRVVNVQLREQAEAAIKDKVTTMSIDDVLSDKQPIIVELTHRLRSVAEGSHAGDHSSGLGLKIVTVQIKEAVVSSKVLWENLQKPFRAERDRVARMAELDAHQQITRQELADREAREKAELEVERQLTTIRADQERERYDRDQAEKARRHQVEQQAEQHAIAERTATDKRRREAELELALQQLELEGKRIVQELAGLQQQTALDQAKGEREKLLLAASVDRDNLSHEAEAVRSERDLGLFRVRREAENNLSAEHLRSQLISRLPEIAAVLPKPEELKAIQIGGDNGGTASSLLGFLAGVLELAGTNGKKEG